VRSGETVGQGWTRPGLGGTGIPLLLFFGYSLPLLLYYECTMHILGHTFSAPPTYNFWGFSLFMSLLNDELLYGGNILGFFGTDGESVAYIRCLFVPRGCGIFYHFQLYAYTEEQSSTRYVMALLKYKFSRVTILLFCSMICFVGCFV